jgi:hypothetical protein
MFFNPAPEGSAAEPARSAPVSQLADALLKRLPESCKPETRGRVERLLGAGAWTDAALTLVACELPQWQLRRLIYEDGEWLCSLSRQPNLPCEIDDTADARHETVAVAILNAFLEARGRTETGSRRSLPPALRMRQSRGTLVCCDNFA